MPCLCGVGPDVVRWGGPSGAGVGGLAGNVGFFWERGRMWGREGVVLCELMVSSIVIVVVDAKVDNELVMRGSGL